MGGAEEVLMREESKVFYPDLLSYPRVKGGHRERSTPDLGGDCRVELGRLERGAEDLQLACLLLWSEWPTLWKCLLELATGTKQ